MTDEMPAGKAAEPGGIRYRPITTDERYEVIRMPDGCEFLRIGDDLLVGPLNRPLTSAGRILDAIIRKSYAEASNQERRPDA